MKLKTHFLKILLPGVICFQITNIKAQTTIPGGVVSGVWNLAGSPYLVQGAIMIADGTTLNIEPGVNVQFQGSFKFLVLGQLLAVGTMADSIKFTALDTTSGWLGIRFDSTSATNDTSRFSFCDVRYGKANGNAAIVNGGGFYFNHFSKAVISNCRISNCKAETWGGGIYCNASNPVIINNTIVNNAAVVYGGGGIHLNGSSPLITGNLFTGNTVLNSNGRGGAICSYGGSVSPVFNNSFISNIAFRGAAIFTSGNATAPVISSNIFSNNSGEVCSGVCGEMSNPVISGNTFTGNSGTAIFLEGQGSPVTGNIISNTTNGRGIVCAYNCTSVINQNSIINGDGGGILCTSINPVTITNNFISNNRSTSFGGPGMLDNGHGGGIYIDNGSSSIIKNNIIVNNAADSLGGGLFILNNSSSITNNTIANNEALKGGALYCAASSSPVIYNSILWGNTANQGSQIYLFDEPSDPDIYYSDIEGGSAGFGINANVFYLGSYANNIDASPQFLLPTSGSGTGFTSAMGDWAPMILSPCLDAGNPNGFYSGTDILGNPRVINGVIDMGAIEYFSTGLSMIENTDLQIYPNPSAGIFYIHSPLPISKIEIIDAKGLLVGIFSVTETIDITQLADGIFAARIYYDNRTVTAKLLKSH